MEHIIDQEKQIEVIILDFLKAFDTMANNKLITKLQNLGIQGKNNKWKYIAKIQKSESGS